MHTFPEIINGEDKSSPFINCFRNNYRHVRKWAKRTNTNCFRIYDRELYHYPLAIDYYAGRFCVHHFLQDTDDEALVKEVEKALRDTFGPCEIFFRSRIRRKKFEQYEKQNETLSFFHVLEHGVTFKVNLVDYLDTGLFLDHRQTRQIVAKEAKDKRVLNLFAYTCAFSVHAAMHGASFTKSVDMSNTYTAWGRENFALNGLSAKNNEIVRADCLTFLENERDKYDIIIIDPPTISRSKKMQKMFDVQEDYLFLLDRAKKLLLDGGAIFFSTNSRKFVFDENAVGMHVQEISQKTLPLDFHDPKIHRCWRLSAS